MRAVLLAHKEQGRTALARPLGAALATSVRAVLAQTELTQLAQTQLAPTELAQTELAQLAQSNRVGTPPGGPVVLVPMPSRRGAVRERGRDPTLAIARHAARLLRGTGREVSVRPVLRMAASVADQSGLDAAARAANLRGAVLLPDQWVGKLAGQATLVVLVDDIITTGASLTAAAETVRRAGIEVAGAALVAATQRRTPSR